MIAGFRALGFAIAVLFASTPASARTADDPQPELAPLSKIYRHVIGQWPNAGPTIRHDVRAQILWESLLRRIRAIQPADPTLEPLLEEAFREYSDVISRIQKDDCPNLNVEDIATFLTESTQHICKNISVPQRYDLVLTAVRSLETLGRCQDRPMHVRMWDCLSSVSVVQEADAPRDALAHLLEASLVCLRATPLRSPDDVKIIDNIARLIRDSRTNTPSIDGAFDKNMALALVDKKTVWCDALETSVPPDSFARQSYLYQALFALVDLAPNAMDPIPLGSSIEVAVAEVPATRLSSETTEDTARRPRALIGLGRPRIAQVIALSSTAPTTFVVPASWKNSIHLIPGSYRFVLRSQYDSQDEASVSEAWCFIDRKITATHDASLVSLEWPSSIFRGMAYVHTENPGARAFGIDTQAWTNAEVLKLVDRWKGQTDDPDALRNVDEVLKSSAFPRDAAIFSIDHRGANVLLNTIFKKLNHGPAAPLVMPRSQQHVEIARNRGLLSGPNWEYVVAPESKPDTPAAPGAPPVVVPPAPGVSPEPVRYEPITDPLAASRPGKFVIVTVAEY